MAKKYNYNSDYMSRIQDEELDRLEERLTAVYANATNEVERQFNGFMKVFEPQYKEKTKQLENGDITQSEFELWSRNKILRSKRYDATVKQMTETLVNTDILSAAMVNSELPLVIAQSYNFVQSLGFAAADQSGFSMGTFQVYNARTVQAIIKDNPFVLSGVNKTKDYRWNKDRINNAITHSIINGDSIPKAARRLQEVSNMDKNGAIRNARTAMTAAENLGRTEASADLREKGVPCNDQWSATLDDRTRDTHLLLDGTFRDKNGYFGASFLKKPLRFPGDPEADLIEPEEIYNCRCRISLRLEGIDHSQDGDLYEKFMKEQHPEDWKAMQESKRERDRAEQRADAIQAQSDLKANIATTQRGNEIVPELVLPEVKEEPQAEEKQEPEYKTATNRKEADKLLKELGFDKVSSGTKKIDEELYIANVNRLSELSSKFVGIPQGMSFDVGKMNANAYVRYDMGGRFISLKLGSDKYQNLSVDEYSAGEVSRHEKSISPWDGFERQFWSMPCSTDNLSVYTITHEYGHIVQETIIFTDEYKNGFWSIFNDQTISVFDKKAMLDKYYKKNHDGAAAQHRKEIIKIAEENNPDFNVEDFISRYGKTDDGEFFAECFANSQCGEPNELGLATAEWLRRKGYDI